MSEEWAEHFWNGPLEKLGIRPGKFYATGHSSISEAIKRRENPATVAQSRGTSVAMIQKDYCGRLELNGDLQIFEKFRNALHKQGFYSGRMVAGLGFEPRTSRL